MLAVVSTGRYRTAIASLLFALLGWQLSQPVIHEFSSLASAAFPDSPTLADLARSSGCYNLRQNRHVAPSNPAEDASAARLDSPAQASGQPYHCQLCQFSGLRKLYLTQIDLWLGLPPEQTIYLQTEPQYQTAKSLAAHLAARAPPIS